MIKILALRGVLKQMFFAKALAGMRDRGVPKKQWAVNHEVVYLLKKTTNNYILL